MTRSIQASLRVAILTMMSAGVVACGGGSEIIPEYPDLSGSWVLNESTSDLAGPGERDEMIGTGGSVDGRPPGGGRRGGGRGGRGGGMHFDPEVVAERLRLLVDAADAITITQTDSTLTIVNRNGLERVLFTDGREVEYRIRDVGEVKAKARWKDERLEVERKLDVIGLKLKEKYERSQDGKHLQVDVELSGGRLIRTFKARRVYDLVEEEGGQIAGDSAQGS